MKVVKEYFPPDILLSKEAMKNILVDFQNREKANSSSNKYKELTITLILSLVGCIISIVGAFSAMTIFWRTITCIISGVLLIFICICVFKWIESYKQVKACCEAPVSVDDILLRSVQDTIQYTAIMRVTTKIKGEMNYLVGPDYFLPHCAMTVDANLDEQENNILQALHDDFGIQEGDVLTTKLLTDQVYFSIKPIHGSVKMNAYAFYDVEIKVQAKAKISETDSRRSWMSLSRMRQKPEALVTNKDVIDLLDTFPKPKDSFVNVLGNISLIWNITSNCGYNCAILNCTP